MGVRDIEESVTTKQDVASERSYKGTSATARPLYRTAITLRYDGSGAPVLSAASEAELSLAQGETIIAYAPPKTRVSFWKSIENRIYFFQYVDLEYGVRDFENRSYSSLYYFVSYDSKTKVVQQEFSSLDAPLRYFGPYADDNTILPYPIQKQLDSGIVIFVASGCTECDSPSRHIFLYDLKGSGTRMVDIGPVAAFEWTGERSFRYKAWPLKGDPQHEYTYMDRAGGGACGIGGCPVDNLDLDAISWKTGSI